MSYNGYNQYSPYWQQTAGQTTPQSTGQIGQPKNSYQPLSSYQNTQRSSHSSVSQAAGYPNRTSYDSSGYGNLSGASAGAGNGPSQESRTTYTNMNDRASIDGATALGNLAYASSLGRDNSLQQAANYTRQQSTANYGTVSPYGVNSAPPLQYQTGDQRRDSIGSSRGDSRNSQKATASPSFGYSANTNNAGYQGPSAGSNVQAQTQYSQPARSSTEQHRINQYSQPSRPPSGQAIQRVGSQAAPSPTASVNQSTPNRVNGNGSDVRGNDQARVHSPQSDTRPSSSQVSKGPKKKPQASQASRDNTKSRVALDLEAKEIAAKRMNEVHKSSAVNSKSGQAAKPTTPVDPQYTTVDPSQTFNQIEYTRRQAAVAAEAAAAKKAAEEAETARIAATQPKPATPQANGTSASGTEPDLAKKDQIELEMKQMIEKMRDYKAKDPSLFTQVWEQVKRGQPPQRAPSQSLQGSATSPNVISGQSPSPSMILTQLPPESDLPAGEDFPPDFDRGRFPSQRRKRGSSTRVSTGRKSSTPKDSKKPATGNQGSPIPPEIAVPTPQVGQIFPDPGSQSMQQAMQQFHQNSKSPVPKPLQNPPPKKKDERKHVTSSIVAPPSGQTPSVTAQIEHQSAQATQAAQAAQAAQPAKSGGTYWPESKKKALAEAAQVALVSAQPNRGKKITTQEIHELLDQNPSYTQMCEILEYRGFVIDRGQFARVLLKAVPDLGSASSPTNTPSANATNPPPAHATNAPSVNATNATHTTPTTATPKISALNSTTKATSATPTAGSFGKLVKAGPDGSAPQPGITQPLPYSVPPTGTLHAPNGYITPYHSRLPGTDQVNGFPRDYRFVDPTSWTLEEQRHYASITHLGPPNGSASQPHPSFSPYQQISSTNPTDQVLDQNGTMDPNGVIPQHPTKQEMARKRTFGEIVDLTQGLSDDEELERHRPRPRFVDDQTASGPSKSVKNVFNQVSWRQPKSGTTTPKPFKYKYSGRDALLLSHDVVEPMNKRRDALRRSTYNPKTIARDVLIGVGKHPTMAPLNAHLDILKDRFKAVDYESDLSTFRWDLADPEGEANMESSDTDDQEAVPVVAAVPRQHPAPTAVMVNDDGGDAAKDKHVPSRTVDSHENPRKRGTYKKSGIRSGIQPTDSVGTLERQLSQSLPYAQDMSKVSSTNPPDLSRFAYSSPSTAQMAPVTPNVTPGSEQKRKGRPPGAKNKQVRPDKGIPKKIKTSSVVVMARTPSEAIALSVRGNPPGEEGEKDTKQMKKKPPVEKISLVGKTTPVGNSSIGNPSSPNTQFPTRPRLITTTPIKSSGLRNSISAMTPTDGIAVVIPSRSPSIILTPQASAKKGRFGKKETATNGMHSSVSSYTMSRCHWENCPAELHNLETLKKHVRKHRRDVDGVYPCLWADCSDSSNPISNSTQDRDGKYRRLNFKSDAEWMKHVESNHVRTKPELLNGTSAHSSDTESSDRLNESHGRSSSNI